MDALAELPDLPRWVEARAILLLGQGDVVRDGGGFVVRNQHPKGRITIVFGRPSIETIEAAMGDRPGRQLMGPAENEDLFQAALPAFTHERAILYGLPSAEGLEPPDDRVRLLSDDDDLGHLEAALREELVDARRRHAIHTAFAGEVAASFSYAHWKTEGLFDCSSNVASQRLAEGLGFQRTDEIVLFQPGG